LLDGHHGEVGLASSASLELNEGEFARIGL